MNKNYNRLGGFRFADPCGSQSHSARKRMHWLFLIVIAIIIEPSEGKIFLNSEGSPAEGLLDPGTVNSESSIIIDPLERLDNNDDPMEFQIGDCFEIQFGIIESYEKHLAGHYVPVHKAIDECALNVAATCEKMSDLIIKVTLK